MSNCAASHWGYCQAGGKTTHQWHRGKGRGAPVFTSYSTYYYWLPENSLRRYEEKISIVGYINPHTMEKLHFNNDDVSLGSGGMLC